MKKHMFDARLPDPDTDPVFYILVGLAALAITLRACGGM